MTATVMERPRTTRILDKLGQRETIGQILGWAGMFLFGLLQGFDVFPEAMEFEHFATIYAALVTQITGASIVQVKRGQQRGEQAATDALTVYNAVKEATQRQGQSDVPVTARPQPRAAVTSPQQQPPAPIETDPSLLHDTDGTADAGSGGQQ